MSTPFWIYAIIYLEQLLSYGSSLVNILAFNSFIQIIYCSSQFCAIEETVRHYSLSISKSMLTDQEMPKFKVHSYY
jgi:hypothetical protein